MSHDRITTAAPAGYEPPEVRELGDFTEETQAYAMYGGDWPFPRRYYRP
ncbi:lasso RiPP family leader peptide-containing protein [Nonomuraea candida]|nr:lasso RiPP family leader peptide-containing protein [Nonomuraea candida]